MENHLDRLAEFQKILADYHIAESGRQVLTEVRLALLVGVSASGRDTIIKELLRSGDYHYVASDTTRKPRMNNGVMEQNGVEYWFRSEDELLEELKAGELLEAEIIHDQQVSGISIRELAKANELNKIAVTNVDLNIQAIVKEKPDTHAFMVLPPNFDEWMKRWSGRGEMTKVEKRRRLETACRIYAAGIECPFFSYVVNHKVSEAAAIIQRSLRGEPDPKSQSEGRQVVEELYRQTKAFLADF